MQQSITKLAWDVLEDDYRLLASSIKQRAQPLYGLVAGLLALDDLDERHQARRIPEVSCRRTRRIVQDLGNA